jgi:hypothetical protein
VRCYQNSTSKLQTFYMDFCISEKSLEFDYVREFRVEIFAGQSVLALYSLR